jgi:ankyrin repeat protein
VKNQMKKQFLSLLLLCSAVTGSFSAFGMAPAPSAPKIKQSESQTQQTKLNELFMACCGKGAQSINTVEKLIQQGMSVNARGPAPLYLTPLFCATYSANLPVIQLLVRRGADVNVTDSIGGTPLIFAARYNDFCLVKFLIANGASVDATTAKGATALVWAVRNENYPMAEFLAQHGAPINATKGFNNSPLISALEKKNWQMKNMLQYYFFKHITPANSVEKLKKA